MLNLKKKQVTALERSVERDFIRRMKNIIETDSGPLIANTSSEEVTVILQTCLEEARQLHIESEQDVFDYSLIRLEQGKNISELDEAIELKEWLGSEFVPSHRKIEELQRVFLLSGKG